MIFEMIRLASLIPESLAPCKKDQNWGWVASPANKSFGFSSDGKGWPVIWKVFSLAFKEAAL